MAQRKGEADVAEAERKDRLIQTRVPRQLASTVKEEARRRRLTVSQLIRNVLEDSLRLVDSVVDEVDQLVSDSVELAQQARRIGHSARKRRLSPSDPLEQVRAWQPVILNRPADCSKCGTSIARGEDGYAGLSDQSEGPRAWLCRGCIETL
jgi:hypothetical protein